MGPRLFRRGNPKSYTKDVPLFALQWGHVFSDVEIPVSVAPVIRAPVLQWGHVFSDVEII